MFNYLGFSLRRGSRESHACVYVYIINPNVRIVCIQSDFIFCSLFWGIFVDRFQNRVTFRAVQRSNGNARMLITIINVYSIRWRL